MTSTRTLADLLPAAAQRTPEATAVVDADRSVTYAELEQTVVAMAATLASAGVAPGDNVGIHCDKSIETIAAVHAVLRVGAAYVPFDPTAPAARIDRIARDAAPRLIVVDDRTQRVWSTSTDAPRTPTITAADLAKRASAFDGPGIDENDLAYVLYTSGSTGDPKGVELSHANALAFVDWACAAFGLSPADRLSSHAPLHFDLSIFDVFAAAASGAALVLVPKAVSKFPVELARWIDRAAITVWYSVPTALTLLITRAPLEPEQLSSLRLVLFAGEVFPVRHLAALMSALPFAAFWNLYGPTETNVCAAHRVERVPGLDDPPIPIGRAVASDRLEIVGPDGERVPPGTVGELVVTGPTVARGYRNDPELTAARFSGERGNRTYRTGDRVVDDGDSGLRFVGRTDGQVKRRGYRVELGDIEVALLRDPSVGDAAVVAVPDDEVTNRLIAIVEPAPGARPVSVDVIRHLSTLLPPSMIPDRVDVVVRLARTSTGKLDRTRLAADAARD